MTPRMGAVLLTLQHSADYWAASRVGIIRERTAGKKEGKKEKER